MSRKSFHVRRHKARRLASVFGMIIGAAGKRTPQGYSRRKSL